MPKTVQSLLVLLLLGGCSLTPAYERPVVEHKESWKEAVTSSQDAAIPADWWTQYGSVELDSLLAQALLHNLDLQASLQRIEQSRAARMVAGAPLLPAVSASGGTTTSSNTSDTAWNAGLDISYTVDLFGANRANLAAAEAGLQSTQYDHEALRLAVIGEVATQYFNLVNYRERLRIADRNLSLAQDLLRLVEVQFEVGRASALEVSQQRSALATAQASRASTELQLKNIEHALAVLAGKAPADFGVQAQELTGLTLPDIAPSQPSALLERRPDIRSAEALLQVADANIGAARAAFFPSLSLGGSAGIGAAAFGDASNTAAAFSSSLLAPIFQGGRLTGNLRQTEARRQELASIYRSTMLTAFREVEDALAASRAAATREIALNVAKEEAQRSYDLSLALYDAGSIDFVTLLDAQRTLLTAQDGYAQSRFERLAASIDLFLALGGGWQSADSASLPLAGEDAARAPVEIINEPPQHQPDGEALPGLLRQAPDQP